MPFLEESQDAPCDPPRSNIYGAPPLKLVQGDDLIVPPHISALVRRTSTTPEMRRSLESIKEAALLHLRESGIFPLHSNTLMVCSSSSVCLMCLGGRRPSRWPVRHTWVRSLHHCCSKAVDLMSVTESSRGVVGMEHNASDRLPRSRAFYRQLQIHILVINACGGQLLRRAPVLSNGTIAYPSRFDVCYTVAPEARRAVCDLSHIGLCSSSCSTAALQLTCTRHSRRCHSHSTTWCSGSSWSLLKTPM